MSHRVFLWGITMISKILIACVLSLGLSQARAEVWCLDGSTAEEHGGVCPSETPRTPDSDGDQPSPPAQQDGSRAECRQQASLISQKVQSCVQQKNAATRTCTWTGSDAEKKMNEKKAKLANDMKSSDTATMQKACADTKTFYAEFEATTNTFKTNCERAAQNCKTSCDEPYNMINEYMNVSPPCDVDHIVDSQNSLDDTIAKCEQLKTQVQKAQDQVAELRTLKEQADKCQKASDGGSDGGSDGSGSGGGSGDGSGSGGSGNSEDNKKKTNSNNNNGLSQLAGIASGLMGMMNQQTPAATTTMAPAELSSDDCRRPEMMNSDVCFCSLPTNVQHPRCNGAVAAGVSTFGNPLQGVGGAKLNNATTGSTGLTLPSSLPDAMPDFSKANQDAGGGPQGMMAGGGGGGFNPGGGNQKPDPPPGRSKSALSADILVGVRGGSNAFGGARGGPRGGGGSGSGEDAYRPRDPDQMPGYALNPNMQAFLPQRGTAAEGGAQVAGSGGMISGIHPAGENIFRVMTERYRALEGTLIDGQP